jgi:hypothetical protein
MFKLNRTKTIIASAAVLSVVASAAYAVVVFTNPTWGTCQAGASPGAATFNTGLALDIGNIVNYGPPGGVNGGDFICSVREGRDARGPYAAIEAIPGPNNAPGFQAAFGAAPKIPPLFQFGGGPGNNLNGNPNPAVLLIYRPTDDPVNPGWAAPAPNPTAAAGQLEMATTACHHFAEAVRQAIAFQDKLNAGTVTVPTFFAPGYPAGLPFSVRIWMEVDVAAGSPTLGEFYKYDITTR